MAVAEVLRGANALRRSILSVRDHGGHTVGLAFLVADTLAFTCAHVVNNATGTSRGEDATGKGVELVPAFYPSEDAVVEATVEHWSAVAMPRHASDDVAVLRLRRPVGGTGPVRTGNPPFVQGDLPVWAFGIPAGRPQGVWHAGTLRGVVASGWLQIDQGSGPGYRVERGFSGGPVWDEAQQAVVGMITMVDLGEVRAAYAIPSAHLLAAVPVLRGELWQPSPFPGLVPYPETMREAFLGRDADVRALVDRMNAERWVTVVGPSGSGKSSLLLAGVVPWLRESSDDVVVIRPVDGRTPVVGGLADSVGQNRTVVVVDQLEEFFDLPAEVRDGFARALFGDGLPSRVRVVSTLRHDFLGQALAHPTLRRAVQGRRLYPLGPLHGEGLRAVVTRAGASAPAPRYEDGLVDRIVADAQASAAAMPLLSHTLAALWDGSPGSCLTHRAYDGAGGVGGALDRAARHWLDEVPVGLAEEYLPHLLAKLVRISSHTAEPTRRVVNAADLAEPERQLARRLTTAGLLVSGGSLEPDASAEAIGDRDVIVELAHDSLFRVWGSLREFVDENRSFLVWSENLRYDAERWAEDGGRRAELLPSDAELDVAARWERERGDSLTAVQREYLVAGRTRRATRSIRRRRALVGIATVLVLLLALGTVLVASRVTTAGQQRLTASRVLAESAAEIERADPALGILAGVAAWRTAPTDEARDRMLALYVKYRQYARVLPAGLGSPRWMAHSADGDVVAVVSEFGRLTVHVDVLSGTIRSAHVTDERLVQLVDVSADGTRVVAFREDGAAIWFDVRRDSPDLRGPLYDLQDARERVPDRGDAPSPSVWWQNQRPRISADGRYVVARVWHRFVRWDVRSGRITHDAPASAHTLWALWLGGPDAATVLMPIVTEAGSLRQNLVEVDLRTGRSRVVAPGGDEWLLSGDGNTLIRCRKGASTVEFSRFRVADGVDFGTPYKDDSTVCLLQGTDSSGQLLVTGGAVLDLDKGAMVARLPVPSGWLGAPGEGVLAERGGRYYQLGQPSDGVPLGYIEVATSGGDTAELADEVLLGDGTRTLSIVDHAGAGAASADHRLQLRSEEFPGQVIAEVEVRESGWAIGARDGIRVDPRGELIADREGPNVVVVRDTATLRKRATVETVSPPESDTPKDRAAVRDLAGNPGVTAAYPKDGFTYFFDAAGNLVTVSDDVVQYWDTQTGDEAARSDLSVLRPAGAGRTLASVAPTSSPGQIAVTYPDFERTRVVDLAAGEIVAELPTGPQTTSVQFDPAGNYVVLHSHDGTIEVRESGSLDLVLGPFQVGEDDEYVARFLGAQRILLAANNAVRTYDLGTGTQIESFRFGGESSGIPHDVSSGGGRVSYQRSDGPPLVVPLDAGLWQRTLCAVVGHRDLAAGELAHLTGDPTDTRDICGQGGK
ncbi:trypsin-like peptidase domain-containing protein [Micromonospora sp. NPDC049374]|uniref:nSTAND1 domain-containing NTPase n=1 Tax=Micromonospora sp. NPDC049374 TaxID=3154352 RepID=UPI00342D4F4B